ncbi:MAG: hypothetical protein WD448_06450 [Woeseia sp.]
MALLVPSAGCSGDGYLSVMNMADMVVVRQHQSNYPNPVCFEVGDVLFVGERDTEYVGWVKVTDPKGFVGWAPLEYIESLLSHKYLLVSAG